MKICIFYLYSVVNRVSCGLLRASHSGNPTFSYTRSARDDPVRVFEELIPYLLVVCRCYARKLLALEEFKGSAAAG